MTLIQSIILGIVQGLTEFLPISSSAHLVLIPHLFGWNIPEAQVFPFDVLVQMGTLVAVILYFWSDLWKIFKAFFRGLINRKPFEDTNARLGWFLILASVPAMFAGMLLKSRVEAVFNDPNATAYFLFGTAALLVLAETVGKRTRNMSEMKWFDALWIGIFQAISIFPGVSRSGSTIVGGMTRHLDRPSAARFSFLMSIPVMLGAGLISILDVFKMPDIGSFLPIILVGFVAALLVGYLSIHWLLNFLNKRSFYIFAIYCVVLAAVVLISGAIKKNAQAAPPTPTPTALAELAITPISNNGSLDQNPLSVAYTSAVEWMLPTMSACAGTIPDFSIITHLVPADQSMSSTDAILLRWGAPDELSAYSAILATERLALIVNPQNPLIALTHELAQKIASAQITTWGEAAQACPECFAAAPDESFSALAPALNYYAAGEEAQQLFIKGVLSDQPVALASALLIFGGNQMLQSISADPAGFGILPAHFLNPSVKEVSVSGLDPVLVQLPVLAISAAEPADTSREWLLCMQKVLNP